MKNVIDLFSELGARLRGFGADDVTQAVMEAACRANGWFTPADVRRAVGAIARDMLSREKLEAWLGNSPAVPVAVPRRVLVVMAGNIPLVGFFDLLCTVVSGHRCLLKPSAKDTVLMEYVVGQLRDIDASVPVEFYDGVSPVDAVIATGSDNANRYFRARYAGIPSLLRGSRQSAAVLSGDETPEQLSGLADDIWAYSGLGCRSVSLLFLPEGCEPTLQMPDVNDKYKNNYRQTRALLTMQGRPFSMRTSFLPTTASSPFRSFFAAVAVIAGMFASCRENASFHIVNLQPSRQCSHPNARALSSMRPPHCGHLAPVR